MAVSSSSQVLLVWPLMWLLMCGRIFCLLGFVEFIEDSCDGNVDDDCLFQQFDDDISDDGYYIVTLTYTSSLDGTIFHNR
jgi:hypothetical protein